MPNEQPNSYKQLDPELNRDDGICHICSGDIDNAGLDHNHCPKCGWVVDSSWLKNQAARKSRLKTRRQIEKDVDSVAYNSQSGAGSLLGIGSGAIAVDHGCSDCDVLVGDGNGSSGKNIID